MNKKLFFLHLLLFCVTFICMLNGQMYGDEGIWSYMGRAWVESDIKPYVGTLDDKPMAIIELHALSYYLFGVNYFFPRLLGGISIIITGFLLYQINKSIFNHLSGIIASTIFCLTTTWEFVNGALTGNTEVFMVLFSTGGFFVFFHGLVYNKLNFRKFLLIGTLLGIATAFKQIAGVSLIAILLLLIWHYKRGTKVIKPSFYILIAFITTFLFIHIPILNNEAIWNYIKFAWLHPRYYETIFWRIPNFFDAFLNSRIVIFYPILLFGLMFRKKISQINLIPYLLIWLLMAFLGVNLSGYYYGHQITQLLPPLALIAGISIVLLINYSQINFQKAIVISFLLMLPYNTLIHNSASILSSPKPVHSSILSHIKGNSKAKELGIWLKKHTQKSDCLYMLGKGPNSTLSYSDRLSASKYINSMRFINENIPLKVLKDLKEKRPKYIIKEPSLKKYPQLISFLKRNYILLGKKDSHLVFKLK